MADDFAQLDPFTKRFKPAHVCTYMRKVGKGRINKISISKKEKQRQKKFFFGSVAVHSDICKTLLLMLNCFVSFCAELFHFLGSHTINICFIDNLLTSVWLLIHADLCGAAACCAVSYSRGGIHGSAIR